MRADEWGGAHGATAPRAPHRTAALSVGLQRASGNTPSEITRGCPSGVGVALGWLSATFQGTFPDSAAFLHWADSFLPGLLLVRRRWRGYDCVYEGENGVLVGLRVGEHLEIHLDVPAAALDVLDAGKLWNFVRFVGLNARKVTRLDITLDDFRRVKEVHELRALVVSGRELNKHALVTHAEQGRFVSSFGPNGGDSLYIGSAKSPVMLRVYDKYAESGGEIDSVRWELQLRRDAARDALLALLLGRPGAEDAFDADRWSEMGVWAAEQLVRFVDFRRRDADENVTRCPRHKWFEKIVGAARRAGRVSVQPEPEVTALHNWAAAALPSLLSTLARTAPAIGLTPEEWVLSMWGAGQDRTSPRHKRAISQYTAGGGSLGALPDATTALKLQFARARELHRYRVRALSGTLQGTLNYT